MNIIVGALFCISLVIFSIMVAASAIGYELEKNGLYADGDGHIWAIKNHEAADDPHDITYCFKDSLCEAVRADSAFIPDWMNNGCFTVQVLPMRQISCKVGDKEIVARNDDYIVKARDGDVFVVPSKEFNTMFIKTILLEEDQ